MRRVRLPLLAAVAAATFTLSALLAPGVAQAGSYPAPPTGLRVTSVSHTGFTVTIQRSANARSYRLLVSTLKSDLYWKNFTTGSSSSALRVFSSTSTTLTARWLTYRSVPYFYRVEAVNGTQHSISAEIGELGLRPAAPTGVRVTSNQSGTYLTWSSAPSTAFRIERADNAAMTLNEHIVSIDGLDRQYTPYGLADGHQYFFRLRAVNLSTASTPSPALAATVQTQEQRIRIMSYNILQTSSDGEQEVGGTLAPWSQRRIPAAELIKGVSPDVVGIQEGQDLIRAGVRQVDDLHSALRTVGADYALADTDSLPTKERAGSYILYKPSVFRTVGTGGHWSLGYNGAYWGAYQELENISTGARFLFVVTHVTAGAGLTLDKVREAETQLLLQDATGQAAADGHVPIVYTGDYNSNTDTKFYPLDGPGVVMRAAHIVSSRRVAQSFYRGDYNSMNAYLRYPRRNSFDIDYVWTPPGVAAVSYGTALNLKDGAFVGTIPSDHNPVYALVVIPY